MIDLNLYEAAHQLEMPSFVHLCSRGLVKKLNSENCIQALTMSQLHSDFKLKNATVKFISKTNDKALIRTATSTGCYSMQY